MQNKNFQIPCNWENRKPLLLERLLYIPNHYYKHEEFKFPSWKDLFENDFRVCIEYCSGNGQWIIEKAQKNLSMNWVAVEKRFSRARKIWLKAKNIGIKNLYVVFGDANPFTQFYLNPKTVSEVYVNFPDPWPKKRHAKHRLIQKDFIKKLQKDLEVKGKITLVTDDQNYKEQMIQTFLEEAWIPLFKKPYYTTKWPDFGDSYFEDLWKGKGRKIFYLQFSNP